MYLFQMGSVLDCQAKLSRTLEILPWIVAEPGFAPGGIEDAPWWGCYGNRTRKDGHKLRYEELG